MAGGMPDEPRPADAGAVPAAVPGSGCGFENGIPAEGARHAVEDNTDAGVGVPRSPGRTPGTCEGPAGTIGAVANRGGADVPDAAGSGTMFAGTGLRPTSVAPATAVMAPGMPMFAYRAGGPCGRTLTSTAKPRLYWVQQLCEQPRHHGWYASPQPSGTQP
jgi:hypothetical protein